MAFLIKFSKSSGRAGANSLSFKIWEMDFPVIGLVKGMPCWSRRIIPILLGGCPSLASLMTKASTSSAVYLHQDGVLLVTGLV